MTNTNSPSIPANWYADPAGGTKMRWWDGTKWTEDYQEPYSAAASAAALTAPAGTVTNTPWIWLVALLPLVQLIPLLLIDWSSMMSMGMGGTVNSQLTLMTSPGYLIGTFGGWILYGLCALFAFFDWRQLKRNGVPRPFHFAWVFLSSEVYVIARSVVVRRRTGQGSAPMWAAIATVIVLIIASIYITVVMLTAMFASIPSFERLSS